MVPSSFLPACPPTRLTPCLPCLLCLPLALPFFCSMETFLPGTPFRLIHRMGWRSLAGFGGMLPGALLLSKRTQPWCVP